MATKDNDETPKSNVLQFPGTTSGPEPTELDFDVDRSPEDYTKLPLIKCANCENMTWIVSLTGECICSVCNDRLTFKTIMEVRDELDGSD